MTWRARSDRSSTAARGQNMAFRRLPGNKHRRFRVDDVLSLAEECDRHQEGNQRHSLRIARASRSDLSTGPWTCPTGSVRACLYVSLAREKERDVREPEGIETPLPGIS